MCAFPLKNDGIIYFTKFEHHEATSVLLLYNPNVDMKEYQEVLDAIKESPEAIEKETNVIHVLLNNPKEGGLGFATFKLNPLKWI